MITVTVVRIGPVFDGRAQQALDRACDAAEERIAKLGAAIIRTEMHRVFKHETPYYRLQNEATPDPPGWKIWDRGVVYGPWLEGTGSRNFPVTRFKGYATYRRKFQEIDRRAPIIADYTVREYLPGMQ